MRYILSFFLLLASGSLVVAQQTSGDQKAIQAQVEAFFTSWNQHDFRDMKNYLAPECDFVNIVGMHWKGRADIEYAHQSMHAAHFKDIPLEKRAVSVRLVKPDVAIVHVLMHREKPIQTPDGSTLGQSDALATFVLVKRKAGWLVEAVENVVVDEKAKPFNPVTMRNNQPKGK